MKKILIILLSICIVSACSVNKQKEEDEAVDKAEATETEQSQAQKEKTEGEEDIDEAKQENTMETFDEKNFSIPTVEIPSPYNDEGNMAREHTMQEYIEMIEKNGGLLRFALDDYPVRAIDNENIRNITNLGDAFIDISEFTAYQVPATEIPTIYNWFLSVQPDDLKGTPASDYRTWEQATNLERGIMQMVYLTAPSLNDLGYIIENNEFEHPAFRVIQQDFFQLGSPSVLIPAPQTATDMTMYDIMTKIKYQWEKIGKFENPAENKEEFEKVYKELRSETNNLLVRINFVLTQK